MLRSVAFSLLLAVLASADCPPGGIYDSYLNKCYVTVSTPKSFIDADNYCISLGGRLADEANAFEGSYISQIANVGKFWIGANLLRSSKWTWTTDAPMDYSNWAMGQPDNSYQCGYVDGNSETWKTLACNSQLPFVCKVSLSATCRSQCSPPTSAPGTCPYDSYCTDDYTFNHENCMCYKYFNDEYRSFYDANAVCAKHGGILAKIPSKDVNDFLLHMTSKIDMYTATNQPWIGLICTPSKGNCSWIDGTPLGSYKNFEYSGGTFYRMISNGQWAYDDAVFATHAYLCQTAPTRSSVNFDLPNKVSVFHEGEETLVAGEKNYAKKLSIK